MTNIIFFGSDEYSTIVLNRLSTENNLTINAVVTTPPKTESRTGNLTENQVEKYAKTHQLKLLYYPPNLTDLSNLINEETYGVSASFGRILDAQILRLFPNGIYNLHPSLLPQYRNVAPVPYALAMGDQVTGITIFRMDEKIDNGHIIAQIKEPIKLTDSTPILLTRLFTLGSDMFVNWIKNPHSSKIQMRQNETELIFTRKLNRQSGFIEWSVFTKFLANEKLIITDTNNPLITLRLTHFPERNYAREIINDLYRSLYGYEKLWTIIPSGKDVFITSISPLMLQLPGKPRAITWTEFAKYYLIK